MGERSCWNINLFTIYCPYIYFTGQIFRKKKTTKWSPQIPAQTFNFCGYSVSPHDKFWDQNWTNIGSYDGLLRHLRKRTLVEKVVNRKCSSFIIRSVISSQNCNLRTKSFSLSTCTRWISYGWKVWAFTIRWIVCRLTLHTVYKYAST